MKIFNFILSFLFICLTGKAQPADSIAAPAKFYHIFNLEAGTGLLRTYTQASYALQQNNLFLKVKASAESKNTVFNSSLPKYEDISLLFGTVFSVNQRHHFSIGAGMSYLSYTDISQYGGGGVVPAIFPPPTYNPSINKTSYHSIAFPVELKFNFLQDKHFGIGTSLSADVNSKYAFYGVSAGLIFGKLK